MPPHLFRSVKLVAYNSQSLQACSVVIQVSDGRRLGHAMNRMICMSALLISYLQAIITPLHAVTEQLGITKKKKKPSNIIAEGCRRMQLASSGTRNSIDFESNAEDEMYA